MRHRMQRFASHATRPLALLRVMAPGVQTDTQGAGSQWWHITGTEIPSRSQVKTWTREARGRNWLSLMKAQASSQLRQPVHLLGWIIKTFAIVSSFPVRHQGERRDVRGHVTESVLQ